MLRACDVDGSFHGRFLPLADAFARGFKCEQNVEAHGSAREPINRPAAYQPCGAEPGRALHLRAKPRSGRESELGISA
jgi:hypothetical protein